MASETGTDFHGLNVHNKLKPKSGLRRIVYAPRSQNSRSSRYVIWQIKKTISEIRISLRNRREILDVFPGFAPPAQPALSLRTIS